MFFRWFLGFELRESSVLDAIRSLRQKVDIYMTRQQGLEKPGEARPMRHLAELAECWLQVFRFLYLGFLVFQAFLLSLPMLRICRDRYGLALGCRLKYVSSFFSFRLV